jgi:hypothetical protein
MRKCSNLPRRSFFTLTIGQLDNRHNIVPLAHLPPWLELRHSWRHLLDRVNLFDSSCQFCLQYVQYPKSMRKCVCECVNIERRQQVYENQEKRQQGTRLYVQYPGQQQLIRISGFSRAKTLVAAMTANLLKP